MNEKLNNISEDSEASIAKTEWDGLGDDLDWDKHVEQAQQLCDQAEALDSLDMNEEKIDDDTFKLMREFHERVVNEKSEMFKSRAKQEKIEREFNEALTSLDELEGYAESEDPRVVRETVRYHDEEIPVYRLRGFPMKFLSHMINYRENDSGWEKGRELSDALMEKPGLWNKYKPADIEVSESGWNSKGGGLANTLSASYVDLATGIDSYDHLPKVSHSPIPSSARVIYGISKVRPMSVLFAKHVDGRTSPQLDNPNEVLYQGVDTIDKLNADNAATSMYNEVAMLRYDDSGNIVPVDFMVTDMKNVLNATEEMPEQDYYGRHTGAYYANAIKRHAAEHEIPIVLIEREYYPRTAEDYAQNLDKLLGIMSPEELFSQMPDGSKNQILQKFLSGDVVSAWGYIKDDGAKEKLSKLADLSGDTKTKELLDDFLVLNGLT